MSILFSPGQRLLRAAVSVIFLGCPIIVGIISSPPAPSGPPIVTSQSAGGAFRTAPSSFENQCLKLNQATCLGDTVRFNRSDSMLRQQAEIGLSDEFGVAFEDDDSIEMLRADCQQRTYGVDRVVPGPGVAAKAASHGRSNISPPLLV